MAKAIGAYLVDSLKIFLVPVSTISKAADRNLTIVQAGSVLVVLAVIAEALRYATSVVPGGTNLPSSLTESLLETVSYTGFFLISLLVMFSLMIVFGGKSNLQKLFSAKLDLASTVLGGFLLAFVAKAAIAVLFLGAVGGSAGLLINMGEQIGLVTLSLIVGAYSIIVLRFGGELSWLLAVIAGVIHFVLMVGIFAAYSFIVLQNDISSIQQLLQS